MFLTFIFPIILIFDQHNGFQYWPRIYFFYLFSSFTAFFFILVCCFLLYAIRAHILARRVEAQGTEVVWGHCYEILLHLTSVVFVCIGPTKEQAKWYALPQSWEIAVHSPDALLELEIMSGNGFVKQLRRMDHDPLTLDREKPELDAAPDEPSDEQSEPPEPSSEEIRELRRYARKHGMFWGASPASVGAQVGTLILLAAFCLGFTIWFDIALHPYVKTQSDLFTLIDLSVFVIVIGLGSLIWGLWMLPRWRRMRHASRQPREIAEGVIVSWVKPLSSTSSSNEETLLKIRLDDGKERIFRIPHRFIERVRTVGARVRITYIPTIERVTYVLPLDVDTT